MAEKAPLIPVAEPHPHVHRRCKGRSIGRLLTASAAAALIYYGIPYGRFLKYCPRLITRTYHCDPVGESIAVNRAELCLSPECVHAASEILYNLSPNYKELDACDNFEELVCGGKHTCVKTSVKHSDR